MQRGILLATTLLLILSVLGLILTYIGNLLLVPILMTPRKLLNEIIGIMDLKPGDKVIDLGSGDGRLLLAAVNTGNVHAYGYEISPILAYMYRIQSWFNFGKSRRVEMITDSFFKADLTKTDKIYCYLNARALRALVPHFKKNLSNEARIYCYRAAIPDIKAEKIVNLSNNESLFIYSKKSFR